VHHISCSIKQNPLKPQRIGILRGGEEVLCTGQGKSRLGQVTTHARRGTDTTRPHVRRGLAHWSVPNPHPRSATPLFARASAYKTATSPRPCSLTCPSLSHELNRQGSPRNRQHHRPPSVPELGHRGLTNLVHFRSIKLHP
jgi:hypothetical protein